MEVVEINYHGNKQKVGSIIFNERGHLRIFVGYCPGCRNKVTMERTEAEHFANKYHYEKSKRATKRLIKSVDNLTF